jgi:hypothetical protein
VVFCRLRYRLTLRDLSEILQLRGIEVSHEAIRDWDTKLLPVLGDALRKRRPECGADRTSVGMSTRRGALRPFLDRLLQNSETHPQRVLDLPDRISLSPHWVKEQE